MKKVVSHGCETDQREMNQCVVLDFVASSLVNQDEEDHVITMNGVDFPRPLVILDRPTDFLWYFNAFCLPLDIFPIFNPPETTSHHTQA